MNFGCKLEPISYKAGDYLIRPKSKYDPICILYEGEVECTATGKIIKPINLIWDLVNIF
jgi:hypothetical protein